MDQVPLPVLNISFYKFLPLQDLPFLRSKLRSDCLRLHLKGTLILSPEGVNGFIAGSEPNVRELQYFLSDLLGLEVKNPLHFKESRSEQVPFKRMLVKVKREIIPLGDPTIKPNEFSGPRISAKELQAWYDEKRDFQVLDTRNDYEFALGTFDRARLLPLKHFRDFPSVLEKSDLDKAKPLVMFCTGGIRCEKASVVALRQGFSEVYQLDGGILNYIEEIGASNTPSRFNGKCFVFDERMAI